MLTFSQYSTEISVEFKVGIEMKKSQQAYEYIKEQILSGIYLPMEDICDETLQQELGMSRTPIRNALLQLEKERLVNIYPQKGTVVSQLTADDIRMIYEVRYLIEPPLAKKLAENLTYNMRETFLYILHGFQNPSVGVKSEILDFHIQLDRQLHRTIVNSSNNLFLSNMMSNVMDFDQLMRIPTSKRNPEYEVNIQEHVEILQAILSGQAELSKQKLESHILTSMNCTMKYMFFQT